MFKFPFPGLVNSNIGLVDTPGADAPKKVILLGEEYEKRDLFLRHDLLSVLTKWLYINTLDQKR